MPLMATTASGNGEVLPSQNTGIAVSRKGVLVTAFGTDPDGNNGTLLRLWEQSGISSLVTVSLPAGMKVNYAIPVNLRGETAGKKIQVRNSNLQVSLKAFSPMSFILR